MDTTKRTIPSGELDVYASSALCWLFLSQQKDRVTDTKVSSPPIKAHHYTHSSI